MICSVVDASHPDFFSTVRLPKDYGKATEGIPEKCRRNAEEMPKKYRRNTE